MYEKENKTLPLGWAMDKDGNDTTDPTAALAGSLLPMGAHKGYGLAMGGGFPQRDRGRGGPELRGRKYV